MTTFNPTTAARLKASIPAPILHHGLRVVRGAVGRTLTPSRRWERRKPYWKASESNNKE